MTRWKSYPLKRVAEIRISPIDKKSREGQPDVRLCNYTDVYHREVISPDQVFMEATASPEQIDTFRLQEGDVVITKDSESPDDIAIPAFVRRSSSDLVCGYHLAVLRPRDDRLDGRYLYWLFRSERVRTHFVTRATGITRFGLRADVIAGARVSLPPVDTQRIIAAYLDAEVEQIELLISLGGRLLARLPHRIGAVAHDALGSLTRNARLAYAVRWLSGGTPPRDDAESWLGPVPWASTKDLVADEIEDTIEHITPEAASQHSRIAPPNSVLVATRGMALAKRLPLSFIGSAMALNQDLKALLPGPGLDARYLRMVLRAFEDEILSFVVESAHGTRRLETRHLKSLKFPMPPVDQQRKKVAELEDVERQNRELASLTRRQMSLQQERRDALISAAVAGEVDVTKTPREASTA